MGAPCTEAVFGLIWKLHFQDHLAGSESEQVPRKGREGSKTKLSAHPVWDEAVDTMLEDAASVPTRLPVPLPVCSNIIKSETGCAGPPIVTAGRHGAASGGPSHDVLVFPTFRGAARVPGRGRSCNLQDICVLPVVEC